MLTKVLAGDDMRVTVETKVATRQRILEAAAKLFAEKGFEATTTRDIAEAAEIATGTLFNYFATKDAIVASQAGDALAGAHDEFERRSDEFDSFEEELFAYLTAGLRKLKPMRKQLTSLLETTLSPLVAGDEEHPSLRVSHLEAVTRLAMKHGLGELSTLALQLYWTLCTGVFVYWANDRSPKQEDTLALLDHSLEMFVGWLRDQSDRPNAAARKKK